MDSSKKNKAMLMMAVCALLWSTGGIFIKMIPWNPLAISGARSSISAVVVYVYMRMSGQKFKFCKPAFLSGGFMCAVFLLFVCANKMTTAANAIVLQYTSPVFVVVLSALFLKKKFRKGDVVAVLATLAGISLFFFDQLTTGNLIGNCFAILAGLVFACTFVSVGELENDAKMTGIFLGQFFTAIIGLPFVFFTDAVFNVQTVSCILLLGIFQLGIPYVLMALALRDCSALACNLIGVLEPLLNPVWVFIFVGERPGFYALIGGAVVICVVTLWCVWSDKAQKALLEG